MEITQDIRYAFRTLKKSPLFAAVAVLSLAIGIGANTAMFTVINAVLFRPTPNVLVVKSENQQRGLSFQILSVPEVGDYRAETSVFSVVAAHRTGTAYLSNGTTERVNVHSIDEHFLDAIQVRPELGRSFSEADMQTGAPRVVILQNAFWRDRFGSDPLAIGRSITIGDALHQIVGVMPKTFADPYAVRTDLWVPLVVRPAQVNRGTRFINAVARLQPNVSVVQAQERMTTLSRALAEKYPEDHEGWSARLVPLQEHITGDQRLPLITLFGAVIAVLLIASTNVASLMSARGSSRRSEIAVRTALGASRWRVTRQILVESSILALLGGAIGLLLAFVTLDVFLANLPQAIAPIDSATIDGRVLLFTAGLILVTSVLFGLLPAREASRTDPNRWLGAVRITGESRSSKARAALVVFEVAVTVVLVSTAALLVNSFARLQAVQMGWDDKNVVTFTVSGPPSSGARKSDFIQSLLKQIQSSPGVQSAASGGVVPLRGAKMIGPVRIDGVTGFSEKEEDLAGLNNVTPDFFRVFGIPVISGRMFDPAVDIEGGVPVMIVNDRLARRFLNGDAIGRRIRVPGQPDGSSAEIVGVVADVHQSGPGEPIRLEMYIPARQSAETAGYFAVRTSGDPSAFMSNVRGIVQSLDSRVVVEQLATMQQMQSDSVAEERFRTMLVSAYSALAVVLAVIGVYSVVAHSVARRRTEIGIRMALGGENGSILRMLLWQGFTPCLIGIAFGFAGSIAAGRAMRALLFGISAEDPLTHAAAVGLVALAGLGACAVPAIQALRTDPALTLKS